MISSYFGSPNSASAIRSSSRTCTSLPPTMSEVGATACMPRLPPVSVQREAAQEDADAEDAGNEDYNDE
jgi:hypothetical protein